MGLLARREHSRVELLRKLDARGFAGAVAEQACDCLSKRGLQSDRRFVESFLDNRIGRGDGPAKISQALAQRGVAGELIGECMALADVNWRQAACSTRERRFGQALPADSRERARQIRFLHSRGFDAEQICHAVGSDPDEQ
ncbi:MAG: regulatory protein RecX [Gammaproteobacteria bacterium]